MQPSAVPRSPTMGAESGDAVKQPLIGSQQAQKAVRRYDTSSLVVEETLQRDKRDDLLALESDLRDAHDCLTTFNQLVKEQQGGLDEITKNTDNAVVNVVKGTEELKEAQRQQKKARKKQCCLVICLLVLIGIVVVVIYVMKK